MAVFDLTDQQKEVEETLDPRDLDMAAQVAEVVNQFEGDVVNVKCKLYKIEKGRRRWLFDAMPIELGDIQNALKTEYGPGLYENHLYINGTLDQRLKLDIGETLADKFPGRNNPETNKGLDSGDILALVREMNANQAEQTRLMMERMEATVSKAIPPQQPQQPAFNPMEMQASMLGMMLKMKEFLGGNESKQQDPIDSISRLLSITSEMQALSGEGGSGPVIASLAKEFLPKLADLAKLQATVPTTPVNPSAGLTPDQIAHMKQSSAPTPPGQATPQPQPQPQSGDKQEMLNNFIINKALNFLLPAAQRNFSPVTYAELLVDQAQIYGMEQEVINYILDPESIDIMIGVNMNVAPVRPWFEQMREAVNAMVTEEPGESSGEQLTSGPASAINLGHVDVNGKSVNPVADTERGNGNQGDLTPNVQSGETI